MSEHPDNAARVRAWFDEHHRALFQFACRLTGSTADAEEIVQEVFLGLLGGGGRYDPERTPVRRYLLGAVRNQALKRLRRREEPRAELPEPAVLETPEGALDRRQVADAVAAAVARLPLAQREVLLLAHYEQWPHAEIAALLGLEVDAVKARLYRARQSLKEMLAGFAPVSRKEHAE